MRRLGAIGHAIDETVHGARSCRAYIQPVCFGGVTTMTLAIELERAHENRERASALCERGVLAAARSQLVMGRLRSTTRRSRFLQRPAAAAIRLAATPISRAASTLEPVKWAGSRVFAERSYTDSLDMPCTLREIDASRHPGAKGPRCLIFESGEMVRRIWTYPDAWQTMSVTDLRALAPTWL